jgi:uncharacterized SAM-binding protein YcdF (DUF218 family)
LDLVAALLFSHEFGNGRPVSWLDSQYKSPWLLLVLAITITLPKIIQQLLHWISLLDKWMKINNTDPDLKECI